MEENDDAGRPAVDPEPRCTCPQAGRDPGCKIHGTTAETPPWSLTGTIEPF